MLSRGGSMSTREMKVVLASFSITFSLQGWEEGCNVSSINNNAQFFPLPLQTNESQVPASPFHHNSCLDSNAGGMVS